jgi:Lrp/AsnC family leucine-responsive transcriptional regulator
MKNDSFTKPLSERCEQGDSASMVQDVKEKRLFTYMAPTGAIDVVNKRILGELQREPRLSMSELGRRIGMSSPAVTERVHRLEETGVIRGYRLDLNPAALGLPIAAYIRIRPNPRQASQDCRTGTTDT